MQDMGWREGQKMLQKDAIDSLDEEMKYDQRELELLTYYKYQMNDKTNNK